MLKKLYLAIVLLILMLTSVALLTACSNNNEDHEHLTFTEITDEAGNITGYSVTKSYSAQKIVGTLVIPDTHNGHPVLSIKNRGFEGEDMTKISIPSTVLSIGENAFSGCHQLTEVFVPKTVNYIGSGAFHSCAKLNKIIVDSDNASYYSKNNCIIEKATQKLVVGCNSSEIPMDGSVSIIGKSAFVGINNFTTLTLPDSIIEIEESAFSRCPNLTECVFGSNVQIIRDSAFSYCDKLSKIFITSSVTYFGETCFIGCNGLEEVHIQDIGSWCNIIFESSESNPLYYAYNLFLDDTLVTNLVVPNTVETIKKYAFAWCSNIVTATIPDSVKVIDGYAFWCSGLVSITLGENINEVSGTAFRGCNTLVEIYNFSNFDIGTKCSNVKNIYNSSSIESKINIEGNYVFYCDNGTNYLISYVGNEYDIVLPNEYCGQSYSVYNYALCRRSLFSSLTISKGITSIGLGAFSECSGLATINVSTENTNFVGVGNCLIEKSTKQVILGCKNSIIPSNVISIGYNAFSGCRELMNITIPFGVQNIYGAFDKCKNLTSVTLPSSIKYIDGNAFYRSPLCNITYNGTISQWNQVKINSTGHSIGHTVHCIDGDIS